MKLIIIEGTDNTGKNTIISNILNTYPVCKVFHCEKPHSTTPDGAFNEQCLTFTNLAIESGIDYTYGRVGAVIHNRSWYGEYVYGCMYRGGDNQKVINMVHEMEDKVRMFIPEDDIVLITLLADNADFLVKNDDGLSISNAKKEKIIEETKRFEEITNASTLKNKHIVYVNDGDKFRTRESIWNEILSYIK